MNRSRTCFRSILALAGLGWMLAGATPTFSRVQTDAEAEVRASVEHFLDLLGSLRFYALGQYFTEDANVTTARSTTSGFVNRTVSASAWLEQMMTGPQPQPFREVLSDVRVDVAHGELAHVKASFEILRDTGVASSGVDFFTLVRQDGRWKIASIAFTSIPRTGRASATPAEPTSGLQEQVRMWLDALPAKSAMHAKHLPTGREIAVRADVPMNTLSVIKIPAMILAFRDQESSRLDLDARYRVRAYDRRRGSGLLQTFAPGLEPTYRDLVTQMIITSDNTATDIVIEKLGMDRINGFLGDNGYAQTRLLATTGRLFRRVWEVQDPAHATLSHAEVFERGFPSDPGADERRFAFEGDPREWLGRTTAREMSRLLEELHGARFTSEAASEEMIAILRRQFYASRLPRFVRFEGVSVAHKTGDWPPVAGNDVGILFHEGGPTIVSVFVNQNEGDFTHVEETIGTIAKALVAAWSP